MQNIVFYVAVHTNYSQVEHSAPFFLANPKKQKIFVYKDFNTEHDKMVEYYRTQWGEHVTVDDFSVSNIISSIRREEINDRIVFLITSSPNFGFGLGQAKCYNLLQKLFPEKIIDVCSIGHCMYGCESCGLSEHNIPVFFSRYFNQLLPYSANDITKKYFKEGTVRCIICPTVGEESFLSNPLLTQALCLVCDEIAKTKNISFLVKLHSFCHLNDSKQPHALFSITEKERESVKILSKHMKIADEIDFNILPFMESANILISDLSSSVSFESLYFEHLSVIAYYAKEVERADKEYSDLFVSFRDARQLSDILTRDKLSKNGKRGKEFFYSKYGNVDGKEVERFSIFRKWNEKADCCSSSKPMFEQTEDSFWQIASGNREIPSLETPILDDVLDYIAFGLSIPEEVAKWTNFRVTHSQQLQKIPKTLWKRLFYKLENDVFDVFEHVQLAHVIQNDDDDPNKAPIRAISLSEFEKNDDIFLIDHAWTTTPSTLIPLLKENQNLLSRIIALMNLHFSENATTDEILPIVISNLWKYLQKYRVRCPDGTEQVAFYLMDEIGSSIAHKPSQTINPEEKNIELKDSDEKEVKEKVEEGDEEDVDDFANIRMELFIRNDNGMAYSVWWPSSNISSGDILYRDWVLGIENEIDRSIGLLSTPFSEKEPIDTEMLLKEFYETRQRMFEHSRESKLNSEHEKKFVSTIQPSLIPNGSKIKVFTDLDLIRKYLTRKEFFVEDEQRCEQELSLLANGVFESSSSDDSWSIFFLGYSDFTAFANLRERQIINQFENESCVCFKHNLAKIIDNFYGTDNRNFLPITYDLATNLRDFVANFLLNEEGKDRSKFKMEGKEYLNPKNTWIVKPWNLSRGMEITVSNSLHHILKISEADPKLACQYIERPLLFNGKKFDIRFIVLARCSPYVEVAVYKTFWLRFANKPFNLTDFDDYEKHFTVMNYGTFNMTHLKDYEFMPKFDEMFKPFTWKEAETRLFSVLAKTFRAAALTDQTTNPKGIRANPKTVTLLGADMMLDENMNPYLLELNFSPDCTRACNYDQEFYNKVFGYLYLGETEWVTKIL